MKSSARNAMTMPAISQTNSTPGDLPDQTRVVVRLVLAPVAGSAKVWVVRFTPAWFRDCISVIRALLHGRTAPTVQPAPRHVSLGAASRQLLEYSAFRVTA